MNDNGPDTLKIPNIARMNEMEYVQYLYDEAVKALLAKPSYENRRIFLEANERLVETRYAYHKATVLMREYYASHASYTHLGAI